MTPEDPAQRRARALAIGGRIRQARLERGMTQAQVAGNRFSKAYISVLETGGAAPSMRSLEYVASRLGVPPEWLVAEHATGERVALPAVIRRAWFADERVYVELDDGRAVGMPVARSRKLSSARVNQLGDWMVVDGGRAIAWPELGEEIGIDDFLGVRVLRESEVTGALGPEPDPAAADHRGGRTRARARRPSPSTGSTGRYAPLLTWLAGKRGAPLVASFREIESVLGRPLPPSARRYTGPWYSETSPLARTLREAGWRATPDRKGERVTLRHR